MESIVGVDVNVAVFTFQRRSLLHGTTTASYFATIHLEATMELCRTIGQCALPLAVFLT